MIPCVQVKVQRSTLNVRVSYCCSVCTSFTPRRCIESETLFKVSWNCRIALSVSSVSHCLSLMYFTSFNCLISCHTRVMKEPEKTCVCACVWFMNSDQALRMRLSWDLVCVCVSGAETKHYIIIWGQERCCTEWHSTNQLLSLSLFLSLNYSYVQKSLQTFRLYLKWYLFVDVIINVSILL